MAETNLYQDIAARTGGDIYIGVVVRYGAENPPSSKNLWKP